MGLAEWHNAQTNVNKERQYFVKGVLFVIPNQRNKLSLFTVTKDVKKRKSRFINLEESTQS